MARPYGGSFGKVFVVITPDSGPPIGYLVEPTELSMSRPEYWSGPFTHISIEGIILSVHEAPDISIPEVRQLPEGVKELKP